MQSKKKILILVSVTILFFVFLHFFGLLNSVENFFSRLINFGSSGIYKIANESGEFIETRLKTGEIIAKLNSKQAELLECNFDSSERSRLKQENEELRSQLNFLTSIEYKNIGADVIGKNIDPVGTSLVINRGAEDGILLGAPTIVGSGILVGKVVKVQNNSAVVRLINDDSSSIAATISNREKSIGLVEGGFGLSVRMNFIPQNEVVNQEDMVVTSGLEEGIPKGLLIGKISVVEKTPQEPFQQAILEPLADLQRISLVTVLVE